MLYFLLGAGGLELVCEALYGTFSQKKSLDRSGGGRLVAP